MATPNINVFAKGVFKFNSPYAEAINENQLLTVSGIRRIDELIDERLDVYKFVYDIVKRPMSDMEDDKRNKVEIVTFVTESMDYIYVPANKIVSMPKSSGVFYQSKVFGVNLGPLPSNISLAGLEADIVELVKGRIGVVTTVTILEASATTLVGYDEHDALLGSRDVVKRTAATYTEDGLQGSFFLAYLRLKEKVNVLNIHINNLKCAIKKLKA